MKKTTRKDFIESSTASLLALSLNAPASAAKTSLARGIDRPQIDLDGSWHVQSSAQATGDGALLSSAAYEPAGWYETPVPSTVFAALVRSGLYRNPYYGMNLRTVAGVGYPIGAMFATMPMPGDSPFRPSWWFRTTFERPSNFRGKNVTLHVDGINYRANAWLNGEKIAGSDELAGMWRTFEFDVTRAIRDTNVLAFEVFAPEPSDLAFTFVDWNPMPPDKVMGLYRGVRLSASGGVQIRNPQVVTQLDPRSSSADLTLHVELRNLSRQRIHGTLRANFAHAAVSRPVTLQPLERRTITLGVGQHAELRIERPALWWPAHMGEQPLQDVHLEFEAGGHVSDRADLRFGIREVTSEIDERGHRFFRINGKRMLVLGAGWTPDMMLRSIPGRQEDEIRYVRDMHLNTIRLEGKILDDEFFDLCDRYGIMVLAGWCCCDRWEEWKEWNTETYQIAGESLRAQLRRLRNHPCILTWAYGSDNAPPPDVERLYLRVLHEERWPNPYQAAASERTTLIGRTGVKMTGPYDYVAPSYWLDPNAPGGANGFNSETSPGVAVPPVESLRSFIPAEHLWPIDDVWNYHAGSGHFKNIGTFTRALEARYGKASGVDDYALKAQLMTYEGERAMFEAFRRNKYGSTGVIQWMLNNSWPGLIWHLYDYYLRPGGGYFGTKKACEPLHVQYSYDDRSVVVANELHRSFSRYTVAARVFDAKMRPLFAHSERVDIAPDSAVRAFTVPPIHEPPLYFAHLLLLDAAGSVVSSNLYWLSSKEDVFDWKNSTWYYTPLTAYADFAALQALPKVHLSMQSRSRDDAGWSTTEVTLHNPSSNLAFFVRAAVVRGAHGEEVLPVRWSDNYVTILPGTRTVLTATYRSADLHGTHPKVQISGWNASG